MILPIDLASTNFKTASGQTGIPAENISIACPFRPSAAQTMARAKRSPLGIARWQDRLGYENSLNLPAC